MGSLRLLITQTWTNNCEVKQTKEFFDFYGAFMNLCTKMGLTEKPGLIDARGIIKEKDLTSELDQMCILGTNDNIIKLFDYSYHYIHKKDNMDFGLSNTYITDHVTGFCDVTDFLPIINNIYELNCCYSALKQFMKYGGIVRIDKRIFVLDDSLLMEDIIAQKLPNLKMKTNK